MAKPPEPSKQQSTSSQAVWEPQGEALQNLYGQSSSWLDNNQASLDKLSGEAQSNSQDALVAAAPAWMQQLQGGNLAGYDIAGGLSNSLNDSMGGPTLEQQALNNAGSGQNYSDAYRQNFVNDAMTAQNSMLQGLDARAAASGMSGGSRHGVGTAMGMQDINSNMQSNLANIGYQDYTNNINRQQQAGQNADANLANQQQMLAGLTEMQNKNSSTAIGQQQQVQDFIDGPMQGLLNSSQGLQLLQQMLGNPVGLTEQQSTSNGATVAGGANTSIGTGGANISF